MPSSYTPGARLETFVKELVASGRCNNGRDNSSREASPQTDEALAPPAVMTGLDPVIHAFRAALAWIAGSSPAMTI